MLNLVLKVLVYKVLSETQLDKRGEQRQIMTVPGLGYLLVE